MKSQSQFNLTGWNVRSSHNKTRNSDGFAAGSPGVNPCGFAIRYRNEDTTSSNNGLMRRGIRRLGFANPLCGFINPRTVIRQRSRRLLNSWLGKGTLWVI